MKTKKLWFKITLYTLLAVLVLFFAFVIVIFQGTSKLYIHKENPVKYANWMSQNLSNNAKIVDIAMLGAHDALSNDIDYYSQTDDSTAGSLQKDLIGAITKGFGVRHSKAQHSNVYELLQSGVRYLDIRLSYNEKMQAWYTTHTYFSSEFTVQLNYLIEFMENHKGEALIFDFQHITDSREADGKGAQRAYTEIFAILSDSGILNYIYKANNKELSQLTYGDITQNKSVSRAIMLCKIPSTDGYFYDYNQNIRSTWFNSDKIDTVINGIDDESNFLSQNSAEKSKLRVMQAVWTIQTDVKGLISSIPDWSLLKRARGYNLHIVEDARLTQWLKNLPIVMVDYSDSNYKDFNNKIMQIIIDFNKTI